MIPSISHRRADFEQINPVVDKLSVALYLPETAPVLGSAF